MSFSGSTALFTSASGICGGQRVQDEDAGDAWIGVQLAERGDDVVELDVVGEPLADVAVLEALGEPAHVPLVRLRVVGLPDQHGREARPHLGQAQDLQLVGDALTQLLGDRVAVDHDGRHGHPPRASATPYERVAGILPQPGSARATRARGARGTRPRRSSRPRAPRPSRPSCPGSRRPRRSPSSSRRSRRPARPRPRRRHRPRLARHALEAAREDEDLARERLPALRLLRRSVPHRTPAARSFSISARFAASANHPCTLLAISGPISSTSSMSCSDASISTSIEPNAFASTCATCVPTCGMFRAVSNRQIGRSFARSIEREQVRDRLLGEAGELRETVRR